MGRMSDEAPPSLLQILEDEGIDPARLRETLAPLHPVDLAELLADLEADDRVRVLTTLEPDRAGLVFRSLPHDQRLAVIDAAGEDLLTPILDELSAGDLADVIDHLPVHKERALMARLQEDRREDVQELRRYPPDSAGGMMTKNYVAVPENYTSGEAIRAIQGAVTAETVSNIYAVDADGRLVGVCGIGSVLIHPPDAVVADFMHRDVHFVGVLVDREEVARTARRYKLKAVPVVDNDMKLAGVITLRDLLDVVHEEADEDVMNVAGAGTVHPVHAGVWDRVSGRLPWLGTAMAIELGLAWVMKGHEDTLVQVASLTFFVPIIMAMGGNVGLQSSTTVVRGLATGDIGVGRALRVVLMESRSGLLLGVLCGLLTGVMAWIMNGSTALSARLAAIVTISMVVSVSVAAALGSIIPFLLQRMKRDPAVASGPFITAMNDLLNVTLYLSLAAFLLSRGFLRA